MSQELYGNEVQVNTDEQAYELYTRNAKQSQNKKLSK